MSDILWTWTWARNSIILYFTLEQEISSLNPVTLVLGPLGRGQRQNLRCPSHHQHLTLPRSWQLQQQQGLVTVTPLSLLLEPTTTEVVRPGVKLRGIDRLGTRLPPGEPDNQVQIWSPVTAFLLGALVSHWCARGMIAASSWELSICRRPGGADGEPSPAVQIHQKKTDGLTTLHKQLFQHCQVGKNRNALMWGECIWGGIRWVTTCSGGWLLGWLPAHPPPWLTPSFLGLASSLGLNLLRPPPLLKLNTQHRAALFHAPHWLQLPKFAFFLFPNSASEKMSQVTSLWSCCWGRVGLGWIPCRENCREAQTAVRIQLQLTFKSSWLSRLSLETFVVDTSHTSLVFDTKDDVSLRLT